MLRYAAFLRAINVGGRRIGAKDLCLPFEEIGFREVASFRASGNVVFDADKETAARLSARIEQALEAALGYDVAVFLRTATEVRALAEQQPFDAKLMVGSKGKPQVALLSKKPTAPARKQALALASHEDRLDFGQRELHWLPRAGTQNSALDMKTIERLFGPMTMRTKGTIEQIAAKYFAG